MKEKLLRAKQDFNKRLNQSQRELTRPESQLNIDRTSDFSERFMNHKADKFSSRNRRLSENKENGIADIKSDDLVDFDYRKKTGTAEYGTFSGELAGMSAENKPSINSAIINWSSVDIDFDKDITNEYIELLEWIKNHPIELPHVFLNQMGGERKDPQTIVKYKEADIYMLVNESSMLLNIAVVYGDSIGILMDHGLSKDVRRLVKGEVIRMNDSETIRGIVANPTQTKKSLYEPLYRVFLSWWETAK
ncbi:MAG: hypothetical protein GY855_17545 [candidate division Zixibacteria bacterium]|nr:hypothetical protein [candidate division Zixibacteria bacterium]